jgi:CubicO group peptidase (beta-lactamase class C family)
MRVKVPPATPHIRPSVPSVTVKRADPRRPAVLARAQAIVALLPIAMLHPQQAPTFPARVDAYLAPFVSMEDFSGAVLVAKHGTVMLRKGYGLADKALAVPARPDMAFAIGSITKTFTAAAVALLAQDGKLQLSDPVERYLPDFHPGDTLSIQSVLAHQARIPDYYSFPEFATRRRDAISPADFLTLIASKPLDAHPGYSNSGYVVLAALIAKLSGVSFEDFVRERLLAPLSMNHTGVVTDETPVQRLAPGYDAGVPPRNVQPAPRDSWSWMIGNGSMYSTVDDLNRWLEALREDSIVRWSTLAYPFGWGKRSRFGRSAIEQDGRIPQGYTSYIALYPQDDVTIVVLSNMQVDIAQRIGIDLAGMVFDEHVGQPTVRHEVAMRTPKRDYVGIYDIAPGFTVAIDTTSHGLEIAGPDRAFLPLEPVSVDTFFFRTLYVPIRFDRDDKGVVTQLHWGNSFVAKREPNEATSRR